MNFVTKSFRKDETLTSWILLQHICPHFWAWLLLYSAITPKSEDKYVVKVFNSSEFHLSEMTLFQNPYFSSLTSCKGFQQSLVWHAVAVKVSRVHNKIFFWVSFREMKRPLNHQNYPAIMVLKGLSKHAKEFEISPLRHVQITSSELTQMGVGNK